MGGDAARRSTHFEIIEIRVYVRIKLLEKCVRRYNSFLQSQDRLHNAGQSARCLEMADVRFHGSPRDLDKLR